MSDRKILFEGGKFFGIYKFLAAFEGRRILKGDPLQSVVVGVGTAGQDRACSLPGERKCWMVGRGRRFWKQEMLARICEGEGRRAS